MKTIRLEIHVTAFVHVGEGLTSAIPPKGVPVRMEGMEIRRVVTLGYTRAVAPSAQNIYVLTKEHTQSVLAGINAVLPEKLAHAARLCL